MIFTTTTPPVVAVFVANEHGEARSPSSGRQAYVYRAGKLDALCDKADKMRALGLPALTCAEEEIADVIIRALDTAKALGVDVGKAITVKHAYNVTRPHLHGGKKA